MRKRSCSRGKTKLIPFASGRIVDGRIEISPYVYDACEDREAVENDGEAAQMILESQSLRHHEALACSD